MSTVSPRVKNKVTVSGNPEARQSMVFVHGFGTDQTAWREVAAAFAKDYRLILLDNVGAGGVAAQGISQHHYLDLHGYANDVIAVANELDLQDAVLVGHSVGGMISVLSAIREPKRFSRLVLLCASPRYLDDEGYRGGFTKADLDVLYSSVMGSYTAWADGFAHMVMGNPKRPQLALDFAETLKRIPSETAFTVLCSIFQSDHRADLPKLTQPTLVVQSDNDVAVPVEVAQYLHQHIRGSSLRIIDASGHLPHLSAPAEVTQAMREFLSPTPPLP